MEGIRTGLQARRCRTTWVGAIGAFSRRCPQRIEAARSWQGVTLSELSTRIRDVRPRCLSCRFSAASIEKEADGSIALSLAGSYGLDAMRGCLSRVRTCSSLKAEAFRFSYIRNGLLRLVTLNCDGRFVDGSEGDVRQRAVLAGVRSCFAGWRIRTSAGFMTGATYKLSGCWGRLFSKKLKKGLAKPHQCA